MATGQNVAPGLLGLVHLCLYPGQQLRDTLYFINVVFPDWRGPVRVTTGNPSAAFSKLGSRSRLIILVGCLDVIHISS